MTPVAEKLSSALAESRILMLGVGLLLGIQLRAVFESGFDQLIRSNQYLVLTALGVMIIALALLLMPAAYHWTISGAETRALYRFLERVMFLALPTMALGLATDLYIVAQHILPTAPAAVLGLGMLGLAIFLWYGLELSHVLRRSTQAHRALGGERHPMPEQPEKTSLGTRIQHALMETRFVLPGTQALLGFQFTVVLTNSFDSLPQTVKEIHLAALGLVALSIVILVTPASYHRLVERGEATERFLRFAGNMIIAAMVPLAVGIAADFYVVVFKVTRSQAAAAASAAAVAVLFGALWFGFAGVRKLAARRQGRRAAAR